MKDLEIPSLDEITQEDIDMLKREVNVKNIVFEVRLKDGRTVHITV